MREYFKSDKKKREESKRKKKEEKRNKRLNRKNENIPGSPAEPMAQDPPSIPDTF